MFCDCAERKSSIAPNVLLFVVVVAVKLVCVCLYLIKEGGAYYAHDHVRVFDINYKYLGYDDCMIFRGNLFLL